MTALAAPDPLPAAGPPGPPGPPGRTWPRDLLRAVAGPVLCAVVLIGLLAAWVATGGAGTLTRVRLEVTLAAVPMRAFTPQTAAAVHTATTFLTIKNLSGTADELIAASSPVTAACILTGRSGTAGPRTVIADLVVPAHGTLILSPFGDDLVLQASGGVRDQDDRSSHPDLPAGRHRHHRCRPSPPRALRDAIGCPGIRPGALDRYLRGVGSCAAAIEAAGPFPSASA